MRLTAAAILLLAMSPTLAAAADADSLSGKGPVFNIMGPSTCAGWPKSGKLETAAKAVPLNWVLGFAGGEADRTDPRMFELLQPEKVDAWMGTYCAAHPTDNIPTASRALIADIRGQLPPLAPPPPPEPPMFVQPMTAAPAKPAPRKPAARRAVRRPAAKK